MENPNFNLVIALNVISIEKDLATTFTNKFPFKDGDSFVKLIDSAERGVINKEESSFVKGLFENIIVNRKLFLDKYNAYLAVANKKIVKNSAIVEDTTIKVVRKTREKLPRLPKEYNKTLVLQDIANRGDSKPNEFEQAVLDLNNLKNIRAKLNAKCNRHRYRDSKELSDADCRDISAAISTITKKLKHLL